MANISWSLSIQVAGGPTITAKEGPVLAEATDRIEVLIADGDVDKTVELQPGPASSIDLLLIKSNQYGNGTDITFKVSDGSTDSSAVVLAGPQFYSGGAIMLLGLDPQSLKFSNASTEPAQIEIFIVRDATP